MPRSWLSPTSSFMARICNNGFSLLLQSHCDILVLLPSPTFENIFDHEIHIPTLLHLILESLNSCTGCLNRYLLYLQKCYISTIWFPKSKSFFISVFIFLKKIKTVLSLLKTWHLPFISIFENSIKAKDSKKGQVQQKKKAQATDYTD